MRISAKITNFDKNVSEVFTSNPNTTSSLNEIQFQHRVKENYSYPADTEFDAD